LRRFYVPNRGKYCDMRGYAFDRSWSREDVRLAAVERQLDPVSQAAAGHCGLAAGWRCWEVGAGRGSMVRWLADRVTASGWVLATDIDITAMAGLDQANITVLRHDLQQDGPPEGRFDLIHARLVLEHLKDPAATVRFLASALDLGGWLILEDADGLIFEAVPAANALAALAGPWQRAARAAGWDPSYGRRLVTDLQRAGLDHLAGRAHRSYEYGGDSWAGAQLGIQRMREQIQHAGAPRASVDQALAALADPARLIIGGPIVTAWGQRTH
jgi:SAM-dependent methyltransferase